MRIRLSTKILLAVSGCVLGLAALNVFAVTILAQQQIRDLVRSDVRATGNTLTQIIGERTNSLTQQAHLIANQPILKGYIQSKDKATLTLLAADYAGQMKASGVVFTDLDGDVLADTTDTFPVGSDRSSDAGIGAAINGGDWSGIVVHNNRLLLAVTVPFWAGQDVWGSMTVYSALDSNLAAALSHSVAGSQIAFIDRETVVGSSLPLPEHFPLPHDVPAIVTIGNRAYFGLYAPFATATPDSHIGLVVLQPYGPAMAGYARFRAAFLAISALFMLVALITAWLLSRSITRPLAAVVRAAETVKSGEWPEPLTGYKDDEIGMLQSVFDEMTVSVRNSQEKLLSLIDTDPLTGLDNHRRFQERLIQETIRAKESSESLSLMIVAFDNFAQFNQRFGHAVGDEALRIFGELLKATLPALAVTSRFGGDEFGILLSRYSVAEASDLAESIRGLLIEIEVSSAARGALTCSIGCAEFGVHSAQPEGLALAAQLAVQQAKQLGRNRVCRFDSVPGADSAVDPYQLHEFYRDGSLSTIQTLAAAVDAKDPYTNGHSQRVADYASDLAQRMELSKSDVSRIHTTGTLHDVGKIGVPDAILSKPGPLTPAERAIMETHPVLGEEIVRKAPQLAATLPGVRHHHERWDGAGYPDRLAGDAIPLDARILALADTFDAMTSDRPYRRGMSVDIALDAIAGGAGTQFDPSLAPVFIDMMHERYPQRRAA